MRFGSFCNDGVGKVIIIEPSIETCSPGLCRGGCLAEMEANIE
jgi:hypothetical protein